MEGKKYLIKFLTVLFVLTIAIGIGYYFIQRAELLFLNNVYLAIVYMPSPFYSLLLFSKIFKRKIPYKKFFRIKGINIKDILFTIGIFFTWVFFTLLLIFILGKLAPDIFGRLVTNNEELIANLTERFGEEFAQTAEIPAHPLLLIPITIFGSLTAGLTINMIFALGEEIVWRGYLWFKLKNYSFYKKHTIIGAIWGLWHAPVILQGYNYGTENVIMGAIFFVFFCIAFSLLFGILIEKTKNSIYAAMLHGMFNAFAGIFVILIISYNPFFGGAVGIISIASILLSFLFLRFVFLRKNLSLFS